MRTLWPNGLTSLGLAALSASVRPLLRGLSRTTGIAASVIMPTCNKATYLDLTLATLERQVFPSDLWELVVIDDASADTTPQVLKFYEERGRLPLVHRRCPKNRGRAGARNDALELARGQVVIFLDDDRLTGLDFLLQHTLRHRGDPGVVHGNTNQRIHTHQHPPITRDEVTRRKRLQPRVSLYMDSVTYRETAEAFGRRGLGWVFLTAGNSSVPRERVRAIGGFDEEFRGWGFEDNDLALRLQESGLPLRFEPQAYTVHQVHPAAPMKAADHRRNMGCLFRKHPALDRAALEPLFTLKVPPDQWIKQRTDR